MAIDFGTAHTEYLSQAASLISNTDPRPCTFAAWVRTSDHTQDPQSIFCNTNSTGNPSCWFVLRWTSPNNRLALFTGAYYDGSTLGALTDDQWYHMVMTWETDGIVAFFLDGVAQGTNDTEGVAGATTTGAFLANLATGAAGFDLDGAMAEFGGWNVILTADEISGLAAGFPPDHVRANALVSYAPLGPSSAIGSVQPDWTSGTDWTVNGSPTIVDHPGQVTWARPAGRSLFVPTAAPSGGSLLSMQTSIDYARRAA